MPLDGGQPNRLTDGTQTWSQPVVAPEGDRIAAYRGEPRDPVRNARLVLLDPATGDATEVAPDLDRGRSVISPTGVLFDSDRIWYSIEDRGSTAVYASPAEAVLSGDRVVTGVDVRNGTIAYTDALPTGPFPSWCATSRAVTSASWLRTRSRSPRAFPRSCM